MHLVDSCGWLEWFTDGPLADDFQPYLVDLENVLVPAIVLYEVYKVLKRDVGEEKALLAAAHMKRARIVPFDDAMAFAAADIALKENLAMADAIIVAAAGAHHCPIITSDADFENLPGVTYFPRP